MPPCPTSAKTRTYKCKLSRRAACPNGLRDVARAARACDLGVLGRSTAGTKGGDGLCPRHAVDAVHRAHGYGRRYALFFCFLQNNVHSALRGVGAAWRPQVGPHSCDDSDPRGAFWLRPTLRAWSGWFSKFLCTASRRLCLCKFLGTASRLCLYPLEAEDATPPPAGLRKKKVSNAGPKRRHGR